MALSQPAHECFGGVFFAAFVSDLVFQIILYVSVVVFGYNVCADRGCIIYR